MEFLEEEEVNPAHREIVISDSEQLSPERIISVWGEPLQILPSGPYNRNFSPCVAKWNAHKGASLTLNKETARWIAKRRLVLEGFYIRIGQNFAADWASRASPDQIIEWHQEAGFASIRYRARLNEFISERKQSQTEIWNPGPIRAGGA